jgi:hypothetical protein
VSIAIEKARAASRLRARTLDDRVDADGAGGAAGPRWANHPIKFRQTIAGHR